MAFQLKTIEVKKLNTRLETLQVCTMLHEMGGTLYERELMDWRQDRILEKIRGGEAVPFNWAYGVVPGSDIRSRVDGQHSTELMLKMTDQDWAAVQFPIHAVLSEYECDAAVDLAALFEQFNAPWSVRRARDIIGSHLAVHPELARAVSRAIADKLAGGLVWYHKYVLHLPIERETKCELIHAEVEHRDFMAWCGSFLRDDRKEDVLQKPVIIAAMYQTTLSGHEAARGFWKKVAGGKRHVEPNTIEYKLAEFLELLDLTRRNKAQWPESVARFLGGGQNPTMIDVFATCIRGFESWKANKKVVDIFSPAKTKDAAVIVQEMKPGITG